MTHTSHSSAIDEPQSGLWRPIRRLAVAAWRRRTLIGGCVGACCLAAAALFWFTPRSYEASAEVLITQIGRHDRTIVCEQVLQLAIHDLTERKVVSFNSTDEAAQIAELRSKLTVRNAPGRANILHISCRSGDPEQAAAVLNSVVTAFEDYVGYVEGPENDPGKTGQYSSRQMVRLLLQYKGELDKKLASQKADLFVSIQELRKYGGDPSELESPIYAEPGPKQSIEWIFNGNRTGPVRVASATSDPTPEPRKLFHGVDPSRALTGFRYKLIEMKQIKEFYDMVDDMVTLVDLDRKERTPMAEVISRASPPETPVAPMQLSRMLTLAGFFGMFLGVGLVFCLETFDDRFQSTAEVQDVLGGNVWATVGQSARELRGLDETPSPGEFATPTEAEEFHNLRISLQLTGLPLNKLVVAPLDADDRRSACALKLAVAFAESGQKTLLLDADLRRSRLTGKLNLQSHPGLAELLRQPANSGGLEQPASIGCDNLDVLPAGSTTASPSMLLASHEFRSLLKSLERKYERIVIDAPCPLEHQDCALLGRAADGVLFVAQPVTTRRKTAAAAVDALDRYGCAIVGAVVDCHRAPRQWKAGTAPHRPTAVAPYEESPATVAIPVAQGQRSAA